MALTQNMWVVITTKQRTMHISCLQGSNYLEPRFPIDIIHLPDSCKAITDTFTLPGHSRLIKEVRPGRLGWQQYKFELKYFKIQDFTLIKEIKPKDITEKQLLTALNAVPHVSQLPVQDLTAQLTEINTSYPYIMPGYLKIILAIVATIVFVIIVVICIVLKNKGVGMTVFRFCFTRKSKQ